MSKPFIYGKPAVINGIIKLRNPPSWLVNFVLVPFNKISLFSKDLITSIISFILLFVRVIPKVLGYKMVFKSIHFFINNIFCCIIN